MNDDSLMSPKKEEVKKAPVKAPPKLASEKANSSKPTTSTKGPSGPNIQEEDVGSGLSKEEAEAKVNDVFGSDVASKFEEAKWQDKVEGFKAVGEQLS